MHNFIMTSEELAQYLRDEKITNRTDPINNLKRSLTRKEALNLFYKKAYECPLNSEEFEDYMNTVKYLNSEQTEYILCLKSGINFKPIALCFDSVLSLNKNFLDSTIYEFKKRKDVEYDIRTKQVCVGVFVVINNTHIVLLKTQKENRVKGQVTLITGHVDFNTTAYTTSQAEFLFQNIMKELNEEISINDKEIVIDQEIPLPSIIINSGGTLSELEHMCFVYKMHLNIDDNEIMNNIFSKEPEKHDVFIVSLDEFKTYKGELDNWINSSKVILDTPSKYKSINIYLK